MCHAFRIYCSQKKSTVDAARSGSPFLLALLIVWGTLNSSLCAATYYWDGGTSNLADPGNALSTGGNGDWSTSLANWDNGTTHVAWPGTELDNEAVLGGVAGTVTLTSLVNINKLTFETSGYTLVGTNPSNLNLYGSSPTITVGSSLLAAITAKITGVDGLTKAGDGTLTISGTHSYTGSTFINGGTLALAASSTLTSPVVLGAGNTTLQINGNSSVQGLATTGAAINLNAFIQNSSGTSAIFTSNQTSDTVFGGILRDHPDQSIPSSLGLSKSGVGTLMLPNANLYSGQTTITGGSLGIGNDAALGSGPLNLNVTSGNIRSLDANARTIANSLTLSTNFSFGSNTTGNLRFTGAVQVGSTNKNLTINNLHTEFSGVISSTGTGTLTKLGPGSLKWSGANTYSGPTIVTAGILSLTGNRTATAGAITIGGAATNATLNISNGTFTLSGDFSVGNNNATALGVVNQTGGSITLATNQLQVGRSTGASVGEYNLSGGSLIGVASANRGLILGANSTNKGTFNLSGTGIVSMANSMLQIGRSDANATGTFGTFNQDGGTATFGIISIGGGNGVNNANTTAVLNLTGGTFSAVSFTALSVGNASSSTITIGGTANVTLPAFPTVRGTGSTATMIFDGGILSPYTASTAFLSGLTNAYLTTNGAKFQIDAGKNITISQVLENAPLHAGTLHKSGAGVLTLTGNNSYSGTTTISAGLLEINGSIASATQVLAAGILGGNGTIIGTVHGAGAVAPGNSIGTLHIIGEYNIHGTHLFEISKDNSNSQLPVLTSDLLNITGNLIYDGVLRINISNSELATLAAGDQWNLFDSTFPSTGHFNNTFGNAGDGANLPILNNGLAWNYDYDAGVLSVIAIPEPSKIAILIIFIAAFSSYRNRSYTKTPIAH